MVRGVAAADECGAGCVAGIVLLLAGACSCDDAVFCYAADVFCRFCCAAESVCGCVCAASCDAVPWEMPPFSAVSDFLPFCSTDDFSGWVCAAPVSCFNEFFRWGTNSNTNTRLKLKSRTHNIANAAIILPRICFFRAVELRGFFFAAVPLRSFVFDWVFAAVFFGVAFLLDVTLFSFSDIGESIKTARLNVKRCGYETNPIKTALKLASLSAGSIGHLLKTLSFFNCSPIVIP